jgi:hypothetical protein
MLLDKALKSSAYLKSHLLTALAIKISFTKLLLCAKEQLAYAISFNPKNSCKVYLFYRKQYLVLEVKD